MDSLGVHSSGETEASSSDLKVYYEDDVAFTSDDFTRLMMQSLHNLGYRFIHLWFKNVISITFGLGELLTNSNRNQDFTSNHPQ